MGMAPVAEALTRPPEYPLLPDEKAEVYAYAHDLFNHTLVEGDPQTSVGAILQHAQHEDTAAPSFFAKPFIDGKIADPEVPAFEQPQEVYTWIAERIQKGEPAATVRDWARQSLTHYTQELAGALVAGTPAADIDPLVIEAQSLVLDPTATLDYFEQVQQIRNLLRAEYRELKPAYGAWDVQQDAKLAILEVYLAKTNDILADYWPRVSYIQDQALLTGDDGLWTRAVQFQPSWEVVADEQQRGAFHDRLDYIRHGMDTDASGRVHPVAQRLWQLASKNTVRTDGIAAERVDAQPLFTPEQEQKLSKTMADPETVRLLIERTLGQADLLSSSSPLEGPDVYDPGRRHPAHDGKWQVAYHPTKNTFMVDSVAKVYFVPKRPVSWRTVLITAASHELEHINQGEADEAIKQHLAIAGIKGKRVSPLREGGAMAKQREGEELLFGKASTGKPFMTYASAIHALRDGKSLAEAAEAFYFTHRRRSPSDDAIKSAKMAADRVVRLLRADGHSSQPMAYAEDHLLADALGDASPAARARGAKVTCFDLPDQLRLHTYGLLPQPPEGRDLMRIFLSVAKADIREVLNDV